jgi:hypothetical protein
MLWRESVASRVFADVRQAQWFGMANELAQNARSTRQVADGATGGVVDACGQEALEPAALGVKYSHSGVASSGEFSPGIENSLEDCLAVELGDYRRADIEQQPQAPFVESATIHGS